MNIALMNLHFSDAKLSGSKTNDEWIKFSDNTISLFNKINELKQNNNTDSLTFYSNKTKTAIIDFVSKNKSSLIAAVATSDLSSLNVSNDTILTFLNKLDKNVRSMNAFHLIRESILNKINSAVNHTAPLFTRTDINNKTVNLPDFKGKYVLLDFWASWCEPCRAQSPHIKELYKKYQSKGLVVIAISCDSKYEDWKMAVIKDSIQLFHNILSFTDADMSFLKTHSNIGEASFKGELRKQYNFKPIPAQILINPKGKIIGRIIGSEDELDKKLKKVFGE